MKHKQLLRFGLQFASGTMLSRVLGLARDVLIAATFGASSASDAFFVALRIPNLFRRMFAEGSFASAFVPLLSAARQESLQAQQAFASQCFLRMALYLSLFTIAVELMAPWVAWAFAPGFAADPEQFGLLVDLLRWTFPYLLLIALASLCASWLHCQDSFAAAAYAPVLLNICLIGACLYSWWQAASIVALGVAVLLAGVLQMSWLLWLARRRAMLLTWRWRQQAKIARLYRLMLPTLFSASVTQVNLLIDSILASMLVAASVSWLYFADRLVELPLGLIGVSIATVLLPKLSALHAQQSQTEYQTTLAWGLRYVLGLALPSLVALILIGDLLIRLIYQHNYFTAADVLPVFQALQAYALGLPFFMLIKLLTNAFFAREDTKTPMRCALAATLVNIVLSLILVRFYEHVGLALATAIGAAVNASLLLIILQRRGWFACWSVAIGRDLLSIAAACAVLAAYLIAAPELLAGWLTGSWWALATAVAALVLGGLALYLAAWWSAQQTLSLARRRGSA